MDKHILKSRFLYASVLTHVLIFCYWLWIGPVESYFQHKAEKQVQAQHHAAEATRTEIQDRLENMRKMHSHIEEIAQTLSAEIPNDSDTKAQKIPSDVKKEKSKLETTLGEEAIALSELEEKVELVKQAKLIAETSQSLLDEVKAQQISHMRNITLKQAKALQDELTNDNQDKDWTGEEQLSLQQVQEYVSHYHMQTQQNLADVIHSADQQVQGISIKPELNGQEKCPEQHAQRNVEADAQQSTATELNKESAEFPGNTVLNRATSALQASLRRYASVDDRPTNQHMGKIYDYSLPSMQMRPAELGGGASFQTQGRRIGQYGARTDQLYLDTWYWIGPFAFNDMSDKSKVHPPEQKIDLDAFYPGKDGVVGWQFRQDNTYPLEPSDQRLERSTFYAYTEVYFEKPTTVWVATGCDDECKLWVNGQLIWKSGSQHKAWYNRGANYRTLTHLLQQRDLSENYYQVEFEKGVNKLLVRLDNGVASVFFAMTLNLKST